MGATSSSSATSTASIESLFCSTQEREAFEKIVSNVPIPRTDAAYDTVLAAPTVLPQLKQTQVELLTQAYGEAFVRNSVYSGNFHVLVRDVIHTLPLSCRVATMTESDVEALGLEAAGLEPVDSKLQTVEKDLHRAVNTLFLVRQFTMRFVERTDESPLLDHFTPGLTEDVDRYQATAQQNLSVPIESVIDGNSTDNLAARFLNALLTVLIEFCPNEKTYNLHVEVVNTLLVLLSPVVYSLDGFKQASGDVRLLNPFLYMLMESALPDGSRSYRASGLIRRLLRNIIDQLQATGLNAMANAAVVAKRKAQEMSLGMMSEISEQTYEPEESSYLSRYFTLEGVGSIAASIFRSPWSFVRHCTTREETASPLADRSVLLLLVLLQSCRDTDSLVTSNPFRETLCEMMKGADIHSSSVEVKDRDPRALSMEHDGISTDSSTEKMTISISDLFDIFGSHGSYETSHLMLYTLLYSNPAIMNTALSDSDMERLLLPLLETLYHARYVEPRRLYMLIIVLLMFTQNPTFVRTAHTLLVVPNVSWYQEQYMLDIPLGSLMMVIFTRLVFRNITHFQDNFIHLNAFAALTNLARSAENLHIYAAQGLVGLIEMLAKNEAKLVAQMKCLKSTDKEENDVLAQKHAAYVEFIRLSLGLLSSCLKTEQLPRNPQLIYALLHRADTFAALQRHSEFAAYLDDSPIWSTLVQFQAAVDAKSSSDDVLDADMVLDIIRCECVRLVAASSTSSGKEGATTSAMFADDDKVSYQYEEVTNPEQFFVPYIWQLIRDQTPDFCWRDADNATLFEPSSTTTAHVGVSIS
uniref:Dymeclin n=1 Tax=Peronospora matthiolae TaxID=2874970 RepID=A0AAV1UFA1_9STRA